jgi:hypothetical protein
MGVYGRTNGRTRTTKYIEEERFGPIFFLLKYLYQASKVSGHAFVSILPLSTM